MSEHDLDTIDRMLRMHGMAGIPHTELQRIDWGLPVAPGTVEALDAYGAAARWLGRTLFTDDDMGTDAELIGYGKVIA